MSDIEYIGPSSEAIAFGNVDKLKPNPVDGEVTFEGKVAEGLTDKVRLEGKLKKEKQYRLYYQDIVYKVCLILESRGFANTIVCGSYDSPSHELQDAAERIKRRIQQLEAELNIERGYRIDAEEAVEELKAEYKPKTALVCEKCGTCMEAGRIHYVQDSSGIHECGRIIEKATP